jgi:hypothetical protein
MPRITITTDSSAPSGNPLVLLDERIHSVHLSTGHASSQLVERLAWAISDAEDVELEQHALAARPPRLERRPRGDAPVTSHGPRVSSQARRNLGGRATATKRKTGNPAAPTRGER